LQSQHCIRALFRAEILGLKDSASTKRNEREPHVARAAGAQARGAVGRGLPSLGGAPLALLSRGDTAIGRTPRGVVAGAQLFPAAVVTPGGDPLVILFQSGAPVPANLTTYLGRFDSQTELLIALPVGVSSLVDLFIFADGPAGAGETFTYTVRKIPAGSTTGADTAVTGTLSGATQQEVRVVPDPVLALANLDKLTVELVTSSGAAAVNHICVPKFSYA
ncbi:MAG: hypothetical protein ACPGVG_19160, partial [Mycobacterium sp.]